MFIGFPSSRDWIVTHQALKDWAIAKDKKPVFLFPEKALREKITSTKKESTLKTELSDSIPNGGKQREQSETDAKNNNSYVHYSDNPDRRRGRVSVVLPVLESLVKVTGSYDTTVIFLELRRILFDDDPEKIPAPFTKCFGGAIYYTDEEGNEKELTKKSLGERLRRLKNHHKN